MQFIQPCRTAEVMHSNHAQKPVHTLCSPAAVSGKVATALLIIATTIMSCCSSTTLQKCSTATMPRNLCMPSAALLLSVARWQQPCLSLQLHLGDFAVHTALQNCRSDAQQPCPETCAYPLQPCCSQWQGGNSLAHHCNYTCELLQFYSPAEVQHSNHAHKPVHALCSTAAVSGKVATALLVTATTPRRFCSSYSPAELQK